MKAVLWDDHDDGRGSVVLEGWEYIGVMMRRTTKVVKGGVQQQGSMKRETF